MAIDQYTGQVRSSWRWPAVGTLDGTMAGSELESLRAEYDAASQRRAEARTRRQAAEQGMNAAARDDARLYASALRAGKDDPGPKRQAELEKVATSAALQIRGEGELVAQIEADAVQLRQRRAEAWAEDVHEQRETVAADLLASLDQLTDRIAALRHLDAARSWIVKGDPASALPTTSLLNGASQRIGLGKVIDAMSEAIKVWATSEPVTETDDLLTSHERAT